MRVFSEAFNIQFKKAQVKWTAWKKANVPRARRRTYARRTPTRATSTPTTSIPQATSTPSTSMPFLPNDSLLQALTMPPIVPSSSLPLPHLDNSYMDPFGISLVNILMGGMPPLPTVLRHYYATRYGSATLALGPSVPFCTPLDGSLGASRTTPMVLDFDSMAPSLPLLYHCLGLVTQPITDPNTVLIQVMFSLKSRTILDPKIFLKSSRPLIPS